MAQPIRTVYSTVTRSQARLFLNSEREDMTEAQKDQAIVDIFGNEQSIPVYKLINITIKHYDNQRKNNQNQHSYDESQRRF